jgi:hypothetical protein
MEKMIKDKGIEDGWIDKIYAFFSQRLVNIEIDFLLG